MITFDELQRQVREAMQAHGIEPPAAVTFDGQLHRFSTRRGDPSDDGGWYVLHADGVPAGTFGDWRSESFPWRADRPGKPWTADDIAASERLIEAARAQRAADDAKRYAAAAIEARQQWEAATPADPAHPYIARKRIQAHGIRQAGDKLLVPMVDDAGALASLQTIAPDGSKRFLTGGRAGGSYFTIGEPGQRLYLCEGFATGATIHEVTGAAVACALSAGNLTAVARTLRKRDPVSTLTIVADNDESGTGEREARKAAAASGASVVLIPAAGMDANDYHNAGHDLTGLLAARPGQRRKIVSFESLRVADIPARQWAVDQMIPMAELSLVGASKGIGKSWFTLGASVAVAAGVPFLGRETRQGRALYWATEQDAITLHERAQRWPEGLPDGLDTTHAGLDEGALNRGAAFVAELEAIITDGGYTFVVLDMTGAFVPEDKETNRYEHMNEFFLAIRRCAFRTGAAIVGTWHTGKGAKDLDPVQALIGSTGIGAQAGGIVILSKDTGKETRPEVKVYVAGNHAAPQAFTAMTEGGRFIESAGPEQTQDVDLTDFMARAAMPEIMKALERAWSMGHDVNYASGGNGTPTWLKKNHGLKAMKNNEFWSAMKMLEDDGAVRRDKYKNSHRDEKVRIVRGSNGSGPDSPPDKKQSDSAAVAVVAAVSAAVKSPNYGTQGTAPAVAAVAVGGYGGRGGAHFKCSTTAETTESAAVKNDPDPVPDIPGVDPGIELDPESARAAMAAILGNPDDSVKVDPAAWAMQKAAMKRAALGPDDIF